MKRVVIYHNPACGKSRGALQLLREQGVACEVVEYLEHPLDRETLEDILRLLPTPPADLVRKDRRFRALGLQENDYVTPGQVVALLLEHPELMERPVVVRGRRAVIARPPERVREILD